MTVDELIAVLGFKVEGEENLKRFNDGMERAESRANILVGRMLKFGAVAGTALAAAGGAAVNSFAGVERTMTNIGITADVSRERMEEARRQLQMMADDFAFQNFDEPVKALDALIAKNIEFEQAMALLPSVLATAQAANAVPEDIANSAVAIQQNFGLAADRMQVAFDILAKGGKEGAFELKDMAAYLPSIAPAFKALGYDGVEGLQKLVALFQTVRLEAGTSSEAATALQNVLMKMNSEATANNFKDFGVDLRAEMEAGAAAGMDALDSFVAASKKALQGNMADIPRLFTDMQLAQGMRAILGNEERLSMFEDAMKASEGTIGADLERVLGDTAADIDRTMSAWDRFKTEVGAMLAPAVGGGLGEMADQLSGDRRVADALSARGFKNWATQQVEFQRLVTELVDASPDISWWERATAAAQVRNRLVAEAKGEISKDAPLYVPKEGQSTSSANNADMKAALANFSENARAMGATSQSIANTITNQDNRSTTNNINVGGVTVQSPTQAPAAVGKAIGDAAARAAPGQPPSRIQQGPATP